MAFTAKVLHEELIGPGSTGRMKLISFTLSGGAKTVYFDGFKLKDPENAMVVVGDEFTVGASAFNDKGDGDVAPAIVLTATSLAFTRGHASAGNNWTVAVYGEWIDAI